MCFLKVSIKDKVLTAKKDIFCYKRFLVKEDNKHILTEEVMNNDNIIISPIQQFLYNKEEKYTTELDTLMINGSKGNAIYNGFHSYTNPITAFKESYYDEFVMKCIIPKGSKYYINPVNHEYVSNMILIGGNNDILQEDVNKKYEKNSIN